MQRTEEPKIFVAIRESQTSGDLTEVKRLIKNVADLTVIFDDNTPIQYARHLEHWTCVEAIAQCKKDMETIAKCKIDLEDEARFGSALINALKNTRYDTATMLIEAGAKLTWFTKDEGYDVLHWVVKHSNLQLLELLLNKNASLTYQSEAKQTPIQLAAALGFWDGVKLFATTRKTDEKDEAK